MSSVAGFPKFVLVRGGTGFMGRRLTLLHPGHRARAVRGGSEKKPAAGCEAVPGDALSTESIPPPVTPAGTFVQLAGTAHPNPAKLVRFQSVDLGVGCERADAAAKVGAKLFLHVGVAHQAPMTKSYIAVRSAVEEHMQKSRLDATMLRPWYGLGPGRRWPLPPKPALALMELLPATKESVKRLGLVTDGQMNAALVRAVEEPAMGIRISNVPEIRQASL